MSRIKWIWSSYNNKAYIIVIIDSKHRRIYASSQALRLWDCELSILCGFSYSNSQLSFASVENFIGSLQPARRCRAHLNVELSSRLTQEHRVESGDFVHSHVGQFQDFSDFVHRGDRKPAVLSLSEIQQWNHCTALVAFRVDVENRLDTLKG